MKFNHASRQYTSCKYEMDKADIIRAGCALRALCSLIEKYSECPSTDTATKAPSVIRWFSDYLLPDLLRFIESRSSNYGK